MTFNNIDSVNLTNIDFKNLSEYTMYYKYDLSENIIYYVYDLSENIMQQTVRCSKHLTLLEWSIQQWSSNSLQAGCCQNSVEYWKMYMSVPWIYIYIYTSTYVQLHIFMYILQTGTNIICTGSTFLYRYKHVCTWFRHVFTISSFAKSCQDLVRTCLYILVCTILRFLVRPFIE